MIKIKNNAGKVINVTETAYEILYKNREGFSLYVEEEKTDETEKKETEKTTASKTTKKNTKVAKKSVKKTPAKKKGDK